MKKFLIAIVVLFGVAAVANACSFKSVQRQIIIQRNVVQKQVVVERQVVVNRKVAIVATPLIQVTEVVPVVSYGYNYGYVAPSNTSGLEKAVEKLIEQNNQLIQKLGSK